MADYFTDRHVEIETGGDKISKRATRGCPQGSVLGPTCWNVQFEGLLKALNELDEDGTIAYADDLIKIVRGNSRKELEVKGQKAVDLIEKMCAGAKLKLSKPKTEGIVFNCQWQRGAIVDLANHRPDRKRKQKQLSKLDRSPTIKIGGGNIRFKEAVKYLGVTLDKGLHVHSHVREIRAKTGLLFGKLRRLAGRHWGLRSKAVTALYRAVFDPISTYAAAGWSDLANARDLRVLACAQHSALLATTRAYRTTPTNGLCVIARELPVDIRLEERRAQYHIRKGLDAKVGDTIIRIVDEDVGAARAMAREKAIEIWNSRWTREEKGETTRCFFLTIRDRLNSSIRPDHYVSQVLSGHGDFGSYLERFALQPEGRCECGEEDTPGHFLLDCPLFAPQRESLQEIVAGQEWPRAARALVSTPEAVEALVGFCREALYIKGRETDVDMEEAEEETVK